MLHRRPAALLASVSIVVTAGACSLDPPTLATTSHDPAHATDVPLPCVATLCDPGGLVVEDEALAGGPPVATNTDDAVVSAGPDIDPPIPPSLPFADDAVEKTAAPGGFPNYLAITSVGAEAL